MPCLSKRSASQKNVFFFMAAVMALPYLFPLGLFAATPLLEVRFSPDVTLAIGSTTVAQEDVAKDRMKGTVTLVSAGSLPAGTNVEAYHFFRSGIQLLSLDTTVSLSGSLTAGPGDVVRLNGTVYTLEFDAAANGVPSGVITDAVSVLKGGDLLLSFDTTVSLGGLTLDDEDLARFNGSTFTLYFDGSDAGVPPGLDLNGAHVTSNGHLMLSFDGSGSAGGVAFDDEDVLEDDPVGGTGEPVDG